MIDHISQALLKEFYFFFYTSQNAIFSYMSHAYIINILKLLTIMDYYSILGHKYIAAHPPLRREWGNDYEYMLPDI